MPSPLLEMPAAALAPPEPAPRLPEAALAALFARALDEIDHGLLLLDPNGRILHANHPAQRELSAQRALRVGQGGELCATSGTLHARIRLALHDAERDCRSIVELEHPEESLSLAFVPLASGRCGGAVDAVLVICSRRTGVQPLTLQMYARAHGLTPTEQSVLAQLCAGKAAEEIAGRQGICLSTVRTHIKNMRQKTGATSIRDIVHRVTLMPQIVSTLRMVAANG
ncbi:MAG: helix-turn-helix transcriptional regulator [Xenophilus sp.]